MSEELDYRSMRILPISMLLLLLIIPLLSMSMMIAAVTFSGTGIENIADGSGIRSVYFTCELFNMAASIVSLVCLYRMNGISGSFNYAWIVFVLEMISELIRHIVGLFTRIYGGSLASYIVSGVFNIMPKLFVMAGVSVLLNGLTEMINEMNGMESISKSAAPDDINKLNKIWLATEIIRNLMWLILNSGMYIKISAGAASSGIITGMVRINAFLSVILIIIHIVISVIICINTWNVFRNYYLYRYNKGL